MRIFFIALLACRGLAAQNLVVNPGFETSKSERGGVVRDVGLEGWTMPSDGTSDYVVATPEVRKHQRNSTPGYATIIPFEGDGCVGFLTVMGGYEYICGSVSEPLVKDSLYTISFALATTGNASFTKSRIGIYFTEKTEPRFKERGMPRIPWEPQVTLEDAEESEENEDWTIYTTSYRAAGGERSFIIGDFSSTFEDDPRNTKEASYFFVDNVYIAPEFEVDRADSLIDEVAGSDTLVVIAEPTVPPADTMIAAGKTLTLENIYFETNKSRILPESYQPLYDIIIELKLQPNLKVEIVGHTDKHGDPKLNQKLSEERARAVADFFISKGIDASRITTRGEGQSKPVGDDDQKNRRVEFRFYE